jgi:hypothetical protein
VTDAKVPRSELLAAEAPLEAGDAPTDHVFELEKVDDRVVRHALPILTYLEINR